MVLSSMIDDGEFAYISQCLVCFIFVGIIVEFQNRTCTIPENE